MLRPLTEPENLQRYSRMPWEFADDIEVDAAGTTRRFGECMAGFQREDFKAVFRGLMVATGSDDSVLRAWPIAENWPTCNRHWWERGRGHSKTSDAAVLLLWSILFPPRSVRVLSAAADADQSKLIIDALNVLVRLNNLQGIIDVQARRVINIAAGMPAEGSRVEAIASDVGSSYGKLADIVHCDELSHWGDNSGLWFSLLSTAAKRDNCLMLVATNCGWQATWQYDQREIARTSDDWRLASLDGPQAPWISAASLRGQQSMLSRNEYRRLWDNRWVHSVATPLLSDEQIERCTDAACMWSNGKVGESPGDIFIGFDVARTKDASVIATVERDRHTHIYFLRDLHVMRNVEFAKQRKEVEARVGQLRPWIRRLVIDRGGIGFQIFEELSHIFLSLAVGEILTDSRQGELAVAMRSAFDRGLVRIPDDEDLRSDLMLISAEETIGGRPKIRTGRNRTGHGDRFWAMALAMSATPVDWEGTRGYVGMPVGINPPATAADRARAIDPRNPMAHLLGQLQRPSGIHSLPQFRNW